MLSMLRDWISTFKCYRALTNINTRKPVVGMRLARIWFPGFGASVHRCTFIFVDWPPVVVIFACIPSKNTHRTNDGTALRRTLLLLLDAYEIYIINFASKEMRTKKKKKKKAAKWIAQRWQNGERDATNTAKKKGQKEECALNKKQMGGTK